MVTHCTASLQTITNVRRTTNISNDKSKEIITNTIPAYSAWIETVLTGNPSYIRCAYEQATLDIEREIKKV